MIRENKHNVINNNLVLIEKIYQSFEALEETLGMLKLEEPLFITHVAKRTFADQMYSSLRKNVHKMNQYCGGLDYNENKYQ